MLCSKKILKILNQIDTFSEKKIDNWAKYINSFQSNEDSFFIDNEYLKSFKNQNTFIDTTLPIKYLFNKFLNTDYKTNQTKNRELYSCRDKAVSIDTF